MSSTILLDELLADELRDLQSSELELSRILPKMAAAADHRILAQMFQKDAETATARVVRLDESLARVGRGPRRKTGNPMAGLTKDARHAAGVRSEFLRDARLIASALRISHYRMAAYGNARCLAQAVGQYGISNFLQHALDEEASVDEKLTTLAAILYQEANAAAAAEAAASVTLPSLGLASA